jgi:hypothetical protein
MKLNALLERLSTMGAAWNRFWFTPSDPTVLGAIRVITGVITFYTLLAYSFDLQALIGPEAWTDLPLRQEQYRETPVPYISLDWSDTRHYRQPQTAQEKEYFLKYLDTWRMPPPLPYPKTQQEADEYEAYHHRWGVDPRLVMSKGRPIWSLWFHITDPTWMVITHGAIVACSFLFMIGLGTRVTSVLTWFGALCYIHREQAALFGVDTMMNILLLYLMIGPSGAALSVDRWLTRWWARRQGLPVPPVKQSVSANVALRLIQIHICIIYLAAGLSKLQGQAWWTSTAPWGTIANPEYSPMQYPAYVELLRTVARTRWVFEIAMTGASLGTLVFEIGYPFLIWRPAFRTLLLWFAVLLHLGIGTLMGLKTFSVLMLAFNMAFLQPQTVRWALSKLTPRRWHDEMEPPKEAPPSPPPIVRHEKPPPKPVVASHYKRKH